MVVISLLTRDPPPQEANDRSGRVDFFFVLINCGSRRHGHPVRKLSP